jgi:hypothetical protein
VSAERMTLSGKCLRRSLLAGVTGVALLGCRPGVPPTRPANPSMARAVRHVLADAAAHQAATSPAWPDVYGNPQHPLATSGRAATVLLFIATDCPISNAYAPEVGRIVGEYGPRGVGFFAVHADPSTPAERARTHAAEFGYPCPVLLDPGQSLARTCGAGLTPEAAVLDRAGRVAYLGRIDDLFASYGKRRHAPTTRDLRDALDAVLAGRPVDRPRVPGVGCDIPPPPQQQPQPSQQ